MRCNRLLRLCKCTGHTLKSFTHRRRTTRAGPLHHLVGGHRWTLRRDCSAVLRCNWLLRWRLMEGHRLMRHRRSDVGRELRGPLLLLHRRCSAALLLQRCSAVLRLLLVRWREDGMEHRLARRRIHVREQHRRTLLRCRLWRCNLRRSVLLRLIEDRVRGRLLLKVKCFRRILA